MARLPGGKVVLVYCDDIERVRDGERWRVRLQHKDTFSVAYAIERERPLLTNPVLSTTLPALATLRAKAGTPMPYHPGRAVSADVRAAAGARDAAT